MSAVLEFESLARAFGYSLGVENLQHAKIAVRHGRGAGSGESGRAGFLLQGRETAWMLVAGCQRALGRICALHGTRNTIIAYSQK